MHITKSLRNLAVAVILAVVALAQPAAAETENSVLLYDLDSSLFSDLESLSIDNVVLGQTLSFNAVWFLQPVAPGMLTNDDSMINCDAVTISIKDAMGTIMHLQTIVLSASQITPMEFNIDIAPVLQGLNCSLIFSLDDMGCSTAPVFLANEISVSAIPVPAAAWLLGSGLLSLLGLRRHFA